MVIACVLWLVNFFIFCLARKLVPQGILMYIYTLSTFPIVLWVTKFFKDNEAIRYSLFMAMNTTSAIAFGWALVGPWICPAVFWGNYRFCVEAEY
jgi:hypothetical protein